MSCGSALVDALDNLEWQLDPPRLPCGPVVVVLSWPDKLRPIDSEPRSLVAWQQCHPFAACGAPTVHSLQKSQLLHFNGSGMGASPSVRRASAPARTFRFTSSLKASSTERRFRL